MEELKCYFCGCKLSEKTANEFDDTIMCHSCMSEHTTTCSSCNETIWRNDNAGNYDTPLCNNCYDLHYSHCDNCGRLVAIDCASFINNDTFLCCPDCYDKILYANIHDYGYKPDVIMYGDDELRMGVELEIDIGGESEDSAGRILDVANLQCDHLYCKHDGSIEDGFEMVSHPMDLEYHQNKMPWKNILDKALSLRYRSHQTSTCGLHVHVSRLGLGSDYATQEDVISRIVYFIEAHWNELLKFSRRTEYSINRWASRYGLSDNAKSTYDKAKKGNSLGRYVCLNLLNIETIEFRIFRGTLRYETFIATLQLVHEICEQAKKMTDKQMESLSWSDFVSAINKEAKPELIDYLKSKRLYVNECTEESEDI